VKSGESGCLAQILAVSLAEGAAPAGPIEPGHTDSISFAESRGSFSNGVHYAHDLMTEDDRQFREIKLSFDNVQIGAADAADVNLNANLVRSRRRHRQFDCL
jgi:hypothetical protein